jgi:hypothetical protein
MVYHFGEEYDEDIFGIRLTLPYKRNVIRILPTQETGLNGILMHTILDLFTRRFATNILYPAINMGMVIREIVQRAELDSCYENGQGIHRH